MTQHNQLSTKKGSQLSRWFLLSFAIVALDQAPTANSFSVFPANTHTPNTRLYAEEETPKATIKEEEKPKATTKSMFDPEEEVQRRLERARAVLAKSKAKLEAAANAPAAAATKANVPFFAAKSKTKDPQRKEKLIKAKNEETGLVRADGEVMAAMSEAEEWERRSLLDVFKNELDDDEDVYSEASRQLAERDVAASIWNLRKQMKTEDYLKIFDKNNRFIGEDN